MPAPTSRRLRPQTLELLRRVYGTTEAGAASGVLRDVVVIDTETTGAGSTARLVEVAALHARDGVVVRQFESLVHPGMHIPAWATSIHGITDAMVKGAPTAAAVLPAFLAFVGELPLVAHNASFDRGILAGEFARTALARPGLPMYCTLRLARRVFPAAPNHRLGTLAQYLDLAAHPTHRAVADCVAALGVWRACAERYPGEQLRALHGPAAEL